jgi:hypothetical protein
MWCLIPQAIDQVREMHNSTNVDIIRRYLRVCGGSMSSRLFVS